MISLWRFSPSQNLVATTNHAKLVGRFIPHLPLSSVRQDWIMLVIQWLERGSEDLRAAHDNFFQPIFISTM